MVALLDLGIPLSVMARVALQRPQCEVAVCFSPSPWGFRRVIFKAGVGPCGFIQRISSVHGSLAEAGCGAVALLAPQCYRAR